MSFIRNASYDADTPLVPSEHLQKREDRLLHAAELGMYAGLYAIFKSQRAKVAESPESVVEIVAADTDRLVTELAQGMNRGWAVGVDGSAMLLDVTINSRLLYQEGYGYVSGGAVALAQQINARTITNVYELVRVWTRAGRTIGALVNLLEPVYGRARAQAIAITEMTNIHARGTLRGYQSSNVVTGMYWLTANDDRVCFPAGTMVRTDSGDKTIESLRAGDRVLTRKGYKRIIATSAREYSGDMTTVSTELGSVTSTADHPFWTNENGWVQASMLSPQHTLRTFEDRNIPITLLQTGNKGSLPIGSLGLPLPPTNNTPSIGFEKSVFSPVFNCIPVPVLPISLKGYTLFWDEKIDTVSTDLRLLYELDSVGFKRIPDGFLKVVFATGSAIASQTAKVAVGAWGDAKHLAAVPTILDDWWAAAIFRAIRTIEFLFGAKPFATSFAGNILGAGSSTSGATYGELVRLAPVDREFLGTNRTGLRDLIGFSQRVAGSAAIATTRIKGRFGKVLELSAGRARDFFSGLESGMVVGGSLLLIHNIELYHSSLAKSRIVYDIQVEDEPEFYANGILVHNCPICAPLGGVRFDGEQAIPTDPDEQVRRSIRTSLYSNFVHPGGDGKLARLGGVSFFPAAHVRCRCRIAPLVR